MSTLSITKKDFDEIRGYYEDLAAARKGKLWGFINRKKEEVIPCLFDEVEDFDNGLARVKLNGKKGFVDAKNNFKPTTTIVVKVYGHNLELQALNSDGDWLDSASMYELEDVLIKVDGKKYEADKNGGIKTVNANAGIYKELTKNVFKKYYRWDYPFSTHLNVKEFKKQYGAEDYALMRCKSYGEVEIEIGEDEQFDPNKAVIPTCIWDIDGDRIKMINNLFIYNNRAYFIEEIEGY